MFTPLRTRGVNRDLLLERFTLPGLTNLLNSLHSFPKTLSRALITVETEQLFPCQLHDHNEENVTKLYI